MPNINVIRRVVLQSKPSAPVGSGFTPTSTESANFLARTSGLNDTDKGNYDTLITGLVADGVWSSLDLLYILAAPDSATMLLNLCSGSFGLTPNGTGTFTANQGWAGNGSNGYLDTGFIPSTNAVAATLNSTTIGVYNRTSRTTSNNSLAFGARGNSSQYSYVILLNSTNQWQTSVNASVFPFFTPNSNAQGAYSSTRTGSGTIAGYKNGSSTSLTPNGTATSASVPDLSLYISALHNPGATSQYTTDQLAAAWCGAGMTGAQAVLLHTRINNFLTAYGTNVY